MASRYEDSLGAFCTHSRPMLEGSGAGPLKGRTFAVKDVFDIAGYRTGFGSPEWLETHGPATATASAVRRLLDAGADMVGKTLTDELRLQPDRRKRALRNAGQPGGSGSGAGRVLQRLGIGGRRRCRRLRSRHRLRRFGAASRELLRDFRVPSHRRPGSARRRDPVRPALRCRGLVRARRGTAGGGRPGAARRDRTSGGPGTPATWGRCVRRRRGPDRRGARIRGCPSRGRGGTGHGCLHLRRRVGSLVRDVPGRPGRVDLVQCRGVGNGDASPSRARGEDAARLGRRFSTRRRSPPQGRNTRRSGNVSTRRSGKGTFSSFPPRRAGRRSRTRRSTISKSASATRRCISCASPVSAGCPRSASRWRRSTGFRSGSR